MRGAKSSSRKKKQSGAVSGGRRRASRDRRRSRSRGMNTLSGPSILNFLAANDPSLQTFSESATLASLLSSSAAFTGALSSPVTPKLPFGQPGLRLGGPTPPSAEAQAKLKQLYPQWFYDEDSVPLVEEEEEEGLSMQPGQRPSSGSLQPSAPVLYPSGTQVYPGGGFGWPIGVSTQNWRTGPMPGSGIGGTQALPLAVADETGAVLQPGWRTVFDTRPEIAPNTVSRWVNQNTGETTISKPVILPAGWRRDYRQRRWPNGTVTMEPVYVNTANGVSTWTPPGWVQVPNADNSGVEYRNIATGEVYDTLPYAQSRSELIK